MRNPRVRDNLVFPVSLTTKLCKLPLCIPSHDNGLTSFRKQL